MRQGASKALLPGKFSNIRTIVIDLMSRCKSQVDAYDAIESKIKEFGGHIGYFNVVRTDLASLEFNTDQMIPVQNW